jgi:hypothetical protein
LSPRGRGPRTRTCTAADARKRLADAGKYLEVANLTATEELTESANVATALAVLAAIAASDAACCKALGETSRGDDHADAAALLAQVRPGGETAARDFARLIAFKDQSQYGFTDISGQNLTGGLRRAERLVAFATSVVER